MGTQSTIFLNSHNNVMIYKWTSMREILSSVFANNKGADHVRSLISAFVIRLL